jgi:hypothetical protein
MKIVKLTYNYDMSVFRQTPKYSQVWGDYKFVVDANLKVCDFWIIYSDYGLKPEKVNCAKANIIFIPAECFHTSPRFTSAFLNQFGLVLTVQRELKHPNIRYTHNANPWFIGKSYDELMTTPVPQKKKMLSVVTSNKAFTEGHQKRLAFVEQLKAHFGDQIDVYGRGINDFEDKWDVLADYKYTIAIENDFCDDWVTEKFFDCMLTQTLPFYYGCPNLERFIDPKSFIRIDINNFSNSIKTIETALKEDAFERALPYLKDEKLKALKEHQFFPWITKILDTLDVTKPKTEITLKLNVEAYWYRKYAALKKRVKQVVKR